MNWSKYNYIYKKDNNKYVLYNSLTATLLKLNKEDYLELMELKENPNLLNSYENLDYFKETKIFVEDDEIERRKIEAEVLLRREQDALLDIWIYPTLGCNFKCPYCFQLPYELNMMNDVTLINTINFIKSEIKKTKPALISINWLGGEPLLGEF